MTKINISSWKKIQVGDLFDIHPTKAYKAINSQLFVEGSPNPVVVNSSLNNGVGGYTDRETTEPGGIITFSDTTSYDSIFYQPEPFVGYPHVQAMYPQGEYKDKWNELSLLFFVAVFRKAAALRGFNYSNKFTRTLAASMEIMLPVDSEGTPDWGYMEEFMKQQLVQQGIKAKILSDLLL